LFCDDGEDEVIFERMAVGVYVCMYVCMLHMRRQTLFFSSFPVRVYIRRDRGICFSAERQIVSAFDAMSCTQRQLHVWEHGYAS
jgi:hypothetical protein